MKQYSRCGVVVSLRASEQKVLSLKFYKSTIRIRQEGHPEFKVLRWLSKKVRKQMFSGRHTLNQQV